MSEVLTLENEAIKLRSEGKTTEEIETLNKLLAVDPNFVRAHLQLAVACLKVAEFERAVEHAEKACKLEPEDPFNFTSLSVTYQRVYAGTNDTSFIQKAEHAMDLARRIQSQAGH
ncbi:MAG: hypothetical protein KDA83_16395 [Planctomycetales bacterium]|nr:hypothetical protein [Planctomycetales bacterium]